MNLIKLNLWGLYFIYSIASFERNFSIITTRSCYKKYAKHYNSFKYFQKQNATKYDVS